MANAARPRPSQVVVADGRPPPAASNAPRVDDACALLGERPLCLVDQSLAVALRAHERDVRLDHPL